MSESMKDITNKLPTHAQLQAYIEKIATFLKAFFKLFDQLTAGIKETFAGYKSPFEEATGTDAGEGE